MTALLAVVVLLVVVLISSFWLRTTEGQLLSYDQFLYEGIAGLEVGFESVPGEPDEGERVSLGLIDPDGLRGQFGVKMYRRPIHEAAIDRLKDAIDVFPDLPEAWLHLSRGRLALGQDEAAASALDRALPSQFVPALVHETRRLGLALESGASRLPFDRLLGGVE